MKRQHFTLTELLVVMAIIMILAGLVFPAVSSSRTTAKAAACLSNQKQVITAIIQSMNANKNRFYSPEYTGKDNGVDDATVRWTARLHNRKYLPEYQVMRCTEVLFPPADWQGFRDKKDDDKERNDDVFTYGAVYHPTTEKNGFDFRGSKFLRKSDKDDVAPTKLMLGACSWNTASKSGGALLNVGDDTTSSASYGTIVRAHRGAANIFFLDGRAAAYNENDLKTNTPFTPDYANSCATKLTDSNTTIIK